MQYKVLEERPKTCVLVFKTGDELASGLKQFASEQNLQGSSFKAIGAFSSVKLGWFNWNTKKYEIAVNLDEQVELLSLIGDIADHDGKPEVHAHVVVGKSDGTAHGGHLLEAKVRPTCEVILTESPRHLQKQIDREAGIALIKL
jgi:predicted DNA-binding protein with PD1-like motif